MLNQEWSKLLNEIKEEYELTQTLFNYTKGNVNKNNQYSSLQSPNLHKK